MADTGPTPIPHPSRPDQTARQRLVERARDGDAEAFETIAAEWIPGAWRLARAILHGDDEAAEAVRTSLVAARRELGRLQDAARFDDWLDRILLSECRMRLASAGGGREPASPPVDLFERTLAAVMAGPPPPPRRPGRTRRRSPPWGAALLALASVVVIAAAVTVAAPWLRDQVGARASAAPSVPPATVAPAASTPGQGAVPATPPPTAPPELAVGTLAMVTLDGDKLRVRTVPGTADDATRLWPVLPAGTRMLIVGGPVAVDGYDWWEIQTDGELIDLFGWVAAAKGDEAWIAPTAPRCFGDRDPSAVVGLTRIDFLVCHGAAEVRLQADARQLWDDTPHPADDCGWVRRRRGCEVDIRWLLLPTHRITVELPGGETRPLVVALPPDLAAALRDLPRQTSIVLTVSLDSEEASGCSIRDARTDEPLLAEDHAVTACRLQFVVQALEVRQ